MVIGLPKQIARLRLVMVKLWRRGGNPQVDKSLGHSSYLGFVGIE